MENIINQRVFSESREIPECTPYIRHFSVDEYHKMGELGIFSEDERIELINGVIIKMSPIGSEHAATVKKLNQIFSNILSPNEATIGIQDPVILDDGTEPQPDISILKPRDDTYAFEHPHSNDILLIVEVADTSVDDDCLIKLPKYAESSIPEVWLVNIPERKIDVYQHPIGNKANAGYKIRIEYREADTVTSQAFPEIKIDVSDVLPVKKNNRR